MKVMYKLFQSSWRDDAVVLDKEKKWFASPEAVREINHVGEFFQVAQSRRYQLSLHR